MPSQKTPQRASSPLPPHESTTRRRWSMNQKAGSADPTCRRDTGLLDSSNVRRYFLLFQSPPVYCHSSPNRPRQPLLKRCKTVRNLGNRHEQRQWTQRQGLMTLNRAKAFHKAPTDPGRVRVTLPHTQGLKNHLLHSTVLGSGQPGEAKPPVNTTFFRMPEQGCQGISVANICRLVKTAGVSGVRTKIP